MKSCHPELLKPFLDFLSVTYQNPKMVKLLNDEQAILQVLFKVEEDELLIARFQKKIVGNKHLFDLITREKFLQKYRAYYYQIMQNNLDKELSLVDEGPKIKIEDLPIVPTRFHRFASVRSQ